MQTNIRLRRFAFLAVLLSLACAGVAQGPPGRDRDNPPPGHGGTPPGQAKKGERGERGMPPGQAKRMEEGKPMPPGQAKKYFREQDRDHFYGYYRRDVDRWRGHRRPAFVVGEYIPPTYVVRVVPRTYWVNVAPPPPPGYQYGYYGGYVVAYNPTTRVIADVLDLIDAARSR